MQISENNYESAWAIIKTRYNNKKLLVDTLMDKLFDAPIVNYELAARELKNLHVIMVECLQALKNININTESWRPILNRLIRRKWDMNTNKLYEQSL